MDAESGSRKPAFDHEKLATSLSAAGGTGYSANQLPFNAIEFVDDAKAIVFAVGDTNWKCNLASYALTKSSTGPATAPSADAMIDDATFAEPLALVDPFGFSEIEESFRSPQQEAQQPQQGRGGARGGRSGQIARGGRGPAGPTTSPDGKWTAQIRESNIVLRSSDGQERVLTQDGMAEVAYGRLTWSPDSSALVAWRMEPGDRKEVYRIQSSPAVEGATGGGVGRAILQTQAYALPGDKFNSFELNLFDIAGQKQSKPDVGMLDMSPGGGDPNPAIRWKSDGVRFTYEKYDRGHQRFRLIEVNARTGQVRNIIDEQTRTFIWSAHRDGASFQTVTYLQNEEQYLWVSEKDGWRHIYFVDSSKPEVKITQLTKGEWIIRSVEPQGVDEQARQVWFACAGVYADQDPYLLHFGRVNFDGSGLTILTAGNGNHSLQYSPDRKYVVDTFSRLDTPPMHELRRVSDGKLVVELEKSEIDAAWEHAERFVAKGRDGKTDIWGNILRPRNLDPNRKYPIVESIYAGPQGNAQGSFVPYTFSAAPRINPLTELGFIVVQIEGMGTAGRSKAFHDVCWQNLKDGGFEDRILWMKAAAAKYPYMDISRVGIYGTSAGGQNAAAAVLFHPEFYKVAVANCGCHDNRMDKASWNEQWMGYPVGPQYAASSSIDHAANLQGRLQLVVGELDNNVPPESTIRLVDALVKARKDFEFVMIPGAGHGANSAITEFKRNDFFVRHLLGTEPPNRNASRAGG